MIRTVSLPDSTAVPALGLGTWRMGEQRAQRQREIAAVRVGVDLGMTLIDTAEMYGEGSTEDLLGEALQGLRDKVFLVSKVYPHNSGRSRIEKACEASLRRLRTDRLDLYLLHWRGSGPLAEVVAGMEALVSSGKIRRWGVSNFDTGDMHDLFEAGGHACAVNQILYNLSERGPEFDLIPLLRSRGIPTMAYSPIGQGRLPKSRALAAVAERRGVSPFTIALAWVLRDPAVIGIPKAADLAHVEANRKALDVRLTGEDLADLDADFPPPSRKTPLAML